MPRRDGHSGRDKVSRKRRKQSWLAANKKRLRAYRRGIPTYK